MTVDFNRELVQQIEEELSNWSEQLRLAVMEAFTREESAVRRARQKEVDGLIASVQGVLRGSLARSVTRFSDIVEVTGGR